MRLLYYTKCCMNIVKIRFAHFIILFCLCVCVCVCVYDCMIVLLCMCVYVSTILSKVDVW